MKRFGRSGWTAWIFPPSTSPIGSRWSAAAAWTTTTRWSLPAASCTILHRFPDLLAYYQTRFPYLCVDEAQDTSKIQHKILRLLAARSRNLFLVGDEDQSIYGFRAAWPQALLEFQTVYPEVRVLLMETNYRSTRSIVAKADAFIQRNQSRHAKHMTTDNPQGEPIRVVELEDYIGSSYRYKYRSSKYGKGPVPCCYSYSQSPVTGNIAFGKSIGATPDGRKDGQPVNNGISPANGSEKNGATAACNSVMKLPSIWFQKGAIFNMRLSKGALDTDENKEKVIAMIKVLFENYGQQIQFNVVDNKVFKEAMEHPDEYKDLMVRVSGYSALFTSLSPECQMDVINRAELEL